MPPISNPGSRNGLITALVLFAMLFVVATVFAIYQGVQNTKTREDLDNFRKKYTNVVSEAGTNSPTIDALRAIRETPESGFNASTSAMDVAWGVSSRLANTIIGAKTDETALPAEALVAGPEAITQANTRLTDAKVDLTLPTNLVDALSDATGAVLTRETQIAELRASLQAAEAAVKATNEQVVQVTAAKDSEVAAARAEAAKTSADASQALAANTAAAGDATKAFDAQKQKTVEELVALQGRADDLNREIMALTRQRDEALARVGRATNTSTAALRQGDGKIVRIAGDNLAYINLGSGDQVSVGLTFEVFDRLDGLPAVDPTALDGGQPQGKASIEVIRVGATSSEARVTRLTPGKVLTEGDIISNLVYDPNVKFKFVVYGNFDLDQNGASTAADADVVKQLVGNWGGQVSDMVNAETDFLVIGAQPAIPAFDTEDLTDPRNRLAMDSARAALDSYNNVVLQAQNLGIPILNQNRFLSYIGYLEQAKR